MIYSFRFLCVKCFGILSTALKFFLIFAAVIYFLNSCSREDVVKGYFQDHGMSYPVDTSGISLWSIDFVNIEEDEALTPEAREYVESGLIFVKEYFQEVDIGTLVIGADAIMLSKPVLYRSESGDVGLMIKFTAYGTDKPDAAMDLPVKRVGADKRFWRVENFAYFSKNEYYKWQYGGMVY